MRKKKADRGSRKPAWLGKDVLIELREKKGMYRRWKQDCVISEKYRNVVWTYRDRIRKAKAQMEQIWRRILKTTRRGFIGTFGRRDRPETVYLL